MSDIEKQWLSQLIDGLRLEWVEDTQWDVAETMLGTYTAADGYWVFEPSFSTKQFDGATESRSVSRDASLADYHQRVRAIFDNQLKGVT